MHHGRHLDLASHSRVRGLRERPDVGPVPQEDRAAVLEETPALLLLVGRRAGWTDTVRRDASHHEPQRPLSLGPVESDLSRPGVDPESSASAQELEVVADQPLVLLPLPYEAPAQWRGLK